MGSGAITGGVTGFITNGLNNLLSGNNYMDGSREAARKGLLCGAIAGAVTGGITGGVNAFKAGKNVWWGNNVKYNRSQWSFINTNKPDYIIKYDIPNVGSLSENDCVPTTWAEMEALLGGKRSYDEFVEVSKYIPKTGVETTGLEYKELVLEQFEGASELAKNNWSQLFDPCFFQSSIDNHTYFSFYFHGHADVVRSLWVFERNPLLNTLTFRQPLYNFSRIDSPRLFFIFKF